MTKKIESAGADEIIHEQFARAGHDKGKIEGKRQVYEELRRYAENKLADLDEKSRLSDLAREADKGKIFRQDGFERDVAERKQVQE